MGEVVRELGGEALAGDELVDEGGDEAEHGDAAVDHLGDGTVDGEEEHGVGAEGLVEDAGAGGTGRGRGLQGARARSFASSISAQSLAVRRSGPRGVSWEGAGAAAGAATGAAAGAAAVAPSTGAGADAPSPFFCLDFLLFDLRPIATTRATRRPDAGVARREAGARVAPKSVVRAANIALVAGACASRRGEECPRRRVPSSSYPPRVAHRRARRRHREIEPERKTLQARCALFSPSVSFT